MTDEERRAKNAAAAKRWRDEHPGYDKRTAEDRRDWKRAYNAAHRKELNAAHRTYVAAHPELREYVKTKAKTWRKANPEQARELQKRWQREHPEATKRTRRNSQLRVKYGIEPEDYDRMLETQGGRCGICRTDKPGKYAFAVDHCHDSGRIRGLLCVNCNSAIGKLKDSIPLLEAAISYLKSHQVVGPPT